MSTITSPRDPSGRHPLISTPSSSARPSIDSPRIIQADNASPNRGPPGPARRNRNALREYYNLKKEEQKGDDASSEYSMNDRSDVLESELDREGFDGEAYVKHALETLNLEDLLKAYNQVLTDIRALDAEKKALVYDNYSKLIAATETIRKMRSNMDPLNPMASTLDPAIAQIYERANSVKVDLKASMTSAQRNHAELSQEGKENEAKKQRMVAMANSILDTPERIRQLIAAGKEEEAASEWEGPRRILERWKSLGEGGQDVQDCIDDGDAAIRGLTSNDKSWVNIQSKT